MYSIVRHPLYLANLIMILGLLMYIAVWWFALIGTLLFWIYYERIAFAEEEFLRVKFGAPYLEWTDETPAFLPRFRNWKHASLTFSTRKLLKREYHGFFAIIAAFTCLDIIREIIVNTRNPEIHLGWVILFAIGLITYLILNTLKKKTNMLDEPLNRKQGAGSKKRVRVHRLWGLEIFSREDAKARRKNKQAAGREMKQ